jgi:outer membrane murein-binding lipoprotein Lpp
MLKRMWAVVMATLLVAGCASQPAGDPDYEGVERDAEEAQRELERETAD